jgi:addiction module HigA family antidote
LKKLYADDATKGVPADTVDKLRKMFAFLDDMDDPEEFAGAAIMESAYPNSRPQGHMEPERYGQSAVDLSYRHNRTRDLRREFRGLPLGSKGEETMPMTNPPHPGDFIRTEIIEAAGLTVTAAAIALRVSRPTLSSLLNSKANLSGDMALRIEKAFGVKMDTLMRMQSSYDIAQTRKRENQIRVPRISVLATTH